MTPFGTFVREKRASLGLLLSDVAEAAGVSVASASAYETGLRSPTEDYAIKVSNFLDLSSTERGHLMASLVESTNVINFKPKDRAVAALAYGITKRLNELSPQEIEKLKNLFEEAEA